MISSACREFQLTEVLLIKESNKSNKSNKSRDSIILSGTGMIPAARHIRTVTYGGNLLGCMGTASGDVGVDPQDREGGRPHQRREELPLNTEVSAVPRGDAATVVRHALRWTGRTGARRPNLRREGRERTNPDVIAR